MKRLIILAFALAILVAAAFWWFSPAQVVKRRTENLLRVLTLEAGTRTASRQLAVYSLNALLASEVELDNPSIPEANGTFERQEMESAFSWLCEQARETSFGLDALRHVSVEGDNAEVAFTVNALVQLANSRPVDGGYDVVFHWHHDEAEGWRLAKAVWREAKP